MILSKQNFESVDIDSLVQSLIEADLINRLLIIVPTNRKARTLKKEIISSSKNKCINVANIETLGTISSKLLKESIPFKTLSEGASTVFIKQAARQTTLRYFSIYKNEIPFGTLEKIKNVISEYKRHGINPLRLREEAEKLEKSEKLKALDIADIYEKYIEKCFFLNAYEIGDVYQQLNKLPGEKFQSNFKRLYPEVELVIVNGFDEFSEPEIQIINSLSEQNVNLFINFDYSSKNKYLFEHLDKCYDRLFGVGFHAVEDRTEYNLNSFRKTIKEKLFRFYGVDKKYDYKEKIFKVSAHDRENEIELIAKEIKRLISEENVQPHNICVAFNLIQNYSALVRDLFTKYGLPFNLTDRTPLDNSNPVSTIINFIEIAENDFYFKNILRAISSGFVAGDEFDYSNLHRVASELKIVAGKNNWINILSDSIKNLDNSGDEDVEEINRLRNSYLRALEDIKRLDKLLQSFGGKDTIPGFKGKLLRFIYESKLPFKLLSISQNQEENTRGFSEFLETINEVFDLLEDEYGTEEKFSLRFFMDQLRTICSWARFNVKEKSNYGIQVTSFEEIRGLHYDYLFIGGLCDGDFPTRYMPQIFFSGTFKKQARTHQTEERNRFYQALSVWNKKLYFTHPLTDTGREVVESTYLKDFENIFSISTLDIQNFSDTIYSKEEFELYAGKILSDGYADNISRLKNISDIDLTYISDAISAEQVREQDPFADSIYNGILFSQHKAGADSSTAKENLKTFANKQYSISQLETYAKCPFKFFVERVLNIQALEEPTEDIEAIEMGRILHSVLFEFYTFVRDHNIELGGADEKMFIELRKIIYEFAFKYIDEGPFNSPITFYEKEKLLGINGNERESILSRFIEYESNEGKEYSPKYFEVGFGTLRESGSDKIISDKEPIKINGLKLRGKIDRVEISKEYDSFNIVDYKLSGKKPSFKELKNGISLQLPVYLFAARELLKRKFNKNYSPNEMFIYSLKYAKDEFGKDRVSLGRGEEKLTPDQLVELTLEHIRKYIESISKGFFGLSPHENREEIVCRYCQFKSVCRIQEVL
ncbi:MAG: PD-(D/E)XK nuclease family protein [Bacteroidota bacterium]